MAKLTFHLAVTALLCTFVHGTNEVTKSPETELAATLSPTSVETPAAQQPANNTRYSRLMKILQDPKTLTAKHYRAAAQRVMARADNLPASGMPYRRPPPHALVPSQQKVRPPLMRRIQDGSPPRFNYEAPKVPLSHLPSKGPVAFNAGKVTVYRPPFPFAQPQSQVHPNILIPQSTAVAQSPKHKPSQYQEEYNFRASPSFNGKAIVRPLVEPHDPNYRQHMKELQQYSGKVQHTIQQYPIPQQQQLQSHQHQHQHFPNLHQSKQESHNRPPTFHYEMQRPYEEPVLHPHVKHNQPLPNRAGYAVYENNELSEEEPPYSQPHAHYPPTPRVEELSQYQSLRQQAQQTDSEAAAAQEAEEYIKFMNSNDYFLPKHEPNYKQLDKQQTQHQQPREQLQQPSHALYPQAEKYTHPAQYSKPSTANGAAASGTASAASTNYLNQPIQVSQLFYQEDPVPAIVRGSYQTGSNLFVVNSDGNKAVKHVVPPPSTRAPTTLAPAYSKVRYNTLRNRTPEPLRFEFTEHDAVHSAYTNSPPPSFGDDSDQFLYRTASAAVGSTSTTPDFRTSITNKYVTVTPSSADDPEDDEDVQIASSDFYGRVQLRQPTSSNVSSVPTPPAPVEQKDTEDYCERICANIQDDDEEIVCGSDGYMYTSESQMECYATCLHIDVTVQSKGSCNIR
ncbi:altered inheritance of mitochondria protein 3 [Ceratitis capitata]|uniref:altered inheritance of mitochondria protein 3 n=1 Tax=Ceratitis capitata TaxID=7213 RepID=UPI000329716C|nr:altered inheritance of mitochondria protein 3 [Ceratitis capitata]